MCVSGGRAFFFSESDESSPLISTSLSPISRKITCSVASCLITSPRHVLAAQLLTARDAVASLLGNSPLVSARSQEQRSGKQNRQVRVSTTLRQCHRSLSSSSIASTFVRGSPSGFTRSDQVLKRPAARAVTCSRSGSTPAPSASPRRTPLRRLSRPGALVRRVTVREVIALALAPLSCAKGADALPSTSHGPERLRRSARARREGRGRASGACFRFQRNRHSDNKLAGSAVYSQTAIVTTRVTTLVPPRFPAESP